MLRHGWGTRYFWFDVSEKVNPSTPVEEIIRKGRFTFSKQSGITAADIHGSTLPINFYSQRFIDMLRKNSITVFSTYKLDLKPEMRGVGGLLSR